MMKRILILVFLILPTGFALALDCHPKVIASLPQYIVGYGSLISNASKSKTNPYTSDNVPVTVKGYKRSWSIYGVFHGKNTTFLSVSKDPNSWFNGVLFQLSQAQTLYRYDKRESRYCREEVSPKDLTVYFTSLSKKSQIWIYVFNHKKQKPSEAYPILQSYVDIFIGGCIQIEERFHLKNYAKNCIKTTDFWSRYWVNDRVFPGRPLQHEPYATKIDALLSQCHKTQPEENKKHAIC